MQKNSNVVSLATWREKKLGVQKRGKKWEIAVDAGESYPGGRKKYAREGGFDSEEEAKQREAEILQELRGGTSVTAKNAVTAKNLTRFEDIAREWLENKKTEIRFKSFKRHQEIVELHLIPFFQAMYIEEIKRKDIEGYYKTKIECRQSLPRHKTVLNQIYDFTEAQGLIENNISRLVKPPGAAKPAKIWIDEKNELLDFIDKLKESGSVLFLPVFLAARTGLRRSEILALRWNSFNFTYNYVWVKESLHYDKSRGFFTENTKTSSSYRKIELTTQTLNILKTEMIARNAKKSDYVCLNSDNRLMNPDTLSSNFRKAARRLGYELCFKTLRSSYATILRDAGVEESAIQEDLGHAEISTTQKHYLKTTRMQREKREQIKEKLFDNLSVCVSVDTQTEDATVKNEPVGKK